MATILLIEDETTLRRSIAEALEMEGHSVTQAGCLNEARNAYSAPEDFDAVISDVNLVGDSGLDFVSSIRGDGYDGVVIVVTAYGTMDNAIAAMKLGADEYLQKPVSLEELSVIVDKALRNRRVRARLDLYKRLERVSEVRSEPIGRSEAWKSALRTAERFASLPIPRKRGEGDLPTVLVLGETGAGKGVLAKHIHEHGRGATDADAPFIHVNCAALPHNLIEGELFGHERGAFTDARDARAGLFEMADGGTIFLDEIGEMSAEVQAKLLLVVETGRYRRIGGGKERTVRARIVAATNQELEQRVEAGAFRRDLLYRLNALTVRIPPLRERGDDAVLIALDVLERFAHRDGSEALTLSEDAREAIRGHSWRGNVRELLNVMKRAAILADGNVIDAESLQLGRPAEESRQSLALDQMQFDFSNGVVRFEDVERALIIQAIQHAKGNISQASKLIGLNRGALRYRIEKLGLEDFAQEATAR